MTTPIIEVSSSFDLWDEEEERALRRRNDVLETLLGFASHNYVHAAVQTMQRASRARFAAKRFAESERASERMCGLALRYARACRVRAATRLQARVRGNAARQSPRGKCLAKLFDEKRHVLALELMLLRLARHRTVRNGFGKMKPTSSTRRVRNEATQYEYAIMY